MIFFIFIRDIKGNSEIIINEVNNILITLAKYLESNISKYQDISLKLMKKLFTYFDNYQKLLPDSITRFLNLYHLNYQVKENYIMANILFVKNIRIPTI